MLNLSYVWYVARHAHNVAFQKSDLFFICMLRPVSSEIKIDETEIQAAKVRRHLSSKGISCFLLETSMHPFHDIRSMKLET
jgi:hypothetical protein